MDDENKLLEDQENLEPNEEQVNQEPEDNGSEETTPDMVPLKTLLDVKRQLKETKYKLADYESKQHSQENIAYRDSIKKKYLDNGYEENLANLIADDLASLREISANRKIENEYDILDDEISYLAKTDEFYADAVDYQDDIKGKIKEFKKKGVDLSIEDAYVLTVNHKRKNRENRENRETSTQREILKNKNSGATGGTNVPTAGGTGIKQQYNLDSDDKKALAKLQRLQPGAKWTAEKYYKMVKE